MFKHGSAYRGHAPQEFSSFEFDSTSGVQDARHRCVLGVGDITALQKNVDMLIISALPDYYKPDKGSMVAALFEKGLSVEELSLNKAEDLRKQFNCWLSDKIDPSFSFSRILCFEAERSSGAGLIWHLFRGVYALTNSGVHFPQQDLEHVIMPVLSSGNHGNCDPKEIVSEIVRNFVFWSSRGLRIKQLTIVMYVFNEGIGSVFQTLKTKYERRVPTSPARRRAVSPGPPKAEERAERRRQFHSTKSSSFRAIPSRTDKLTDSSDPRPAPSSPPRAPASAQPIYLISYSNHDEEIVKKFVQVFQLLANDDEVKPVIERLPAKKKSKRKKSSSSSSSSSLELASQGLNEHVELDKKIATSHAVIALLSASYVRSMSCIDVLHLSIGQGKIMPLCICVEKEFPTYIQMLQYTDASPPTYQRLFYAAVALLKRQALEAFSSSASLTYSRTVGSLSVCSEDSQVATSRKHLGEYDVFISYSQRFSNQARAVKEILDHKMPGLRIFIDADCLESGKNWQEALFRCLDTSRVTLCLLTPAYFESPFCKDELAIAKLVHDEDRGRLLAVKCISFEAKMLPKMFAGADNAFLRGESLDQVCDEVAAVLSGTSTIPRPLDTTSTLQRKKLEILDACTSFLNDYKDSIPNEKVCKLYVIATPEDEVIANLVFLRLSKLAAACARGVKIKVQMKIAKRGMGRHDLNGTSMPLLSDAFMKSAQCKDLLHGLINLHRGRPSMVPVLLMPTVPWEWPTFIRCLPMITSSVQANDAFYAKVLDYCILSGNLLLKKENIETETLSIID